MQLRSDLRKEIAYYHIGLKYYHHAKATCKLDSDS